MLNKLILVAGLICIVMISGCTNMYDNAKAFCESRGYDGVIYKAFGQDACIRTLHNDTYERVCIVHLNDRYYFDDCVD